VAVFSTSRGSDRPVPARAADDFSSRSWRATDTSRSSGPVEITSIAFASLAAASAADRSSPGSDDHRIGDDIQLAEVASGRDRADRTALAVDRHHDPLN